MSHRQTVAGGRAFTLVELLVVIAIIGLLVAILVPAVGVVRRGARETANRALISNSLTTAISTFQADGKVGGGLPPSATDADEKTPGSPKRFHAKNPYTKLSVGGDEIRMSGAGLLVWALAGADLLGTPGFRAFRTGTKPSTLWSTDTDSKDSSNADERGAYALDTRGKERFARSGPYVDLAKVRTSTFSTLNKSFDIEAETLAREAKGKPRIKREYPMFLDANGFPILYFKADPSGEAMADSNAKGATLRPEDRGVYHWQDNAPLLNEASADVLLLRGTNKQHMLYRQPEKDDPQSIVLVGFWEFIRNREVLAKLVPHNADSYLLISPGEDGWYGTADDVTNFPHNGRN